MTSTRLQRPSGAIAFSSVGDGPLLVLLHPIGMDRSWWDTYARAWAPRFSVISVDMLGHGDSDRLQGSVHSLADHAADVLEIIRRENAGPAIIAGVSMGGMVAQYAAIQSPSEVAGLILCATAGAFSDGVRAAVRTRGDMTRDGDMQSVVEATIERWFSRQADVDLVDRCRARLLADDWYSWSANWAAISEVDTLAPMSELSLPTLVVAGDADASIPVAVSQKIADAVPGSGFVVMPGASHFGAFESPNEFLTAFNQFLAPLAH